MQSPEGGSGKSPLVSVTPLIPCPGKDILPSKDTDLIHPRRTLWTHQLTYPEWKRRGVLGLPPDDDRDPSDEQQQQHSHCCEHGVSREHLAGPLGQDQAQDNQQENCKGQGGGGQAGPKRQDVRTSGHIPPRNQQYQERPSYLQHSSTDKTHTLTPSCQFQYLTKETSQCSPSRKAHP